MLDGIRPDGIKVTLSLGAQGNHRLHLGGGRLAIGSLHRVTRVFSVIVDV